MWYQLYFVIPLSSGGNTVSIIGKWKEIEKKKPSFVSFWHPKTITTNKTRIGKFLFSSDFGGISEVVNKSILYEI